MSYFWVQISGTSLQYIVVKLSCKTIKEFEVMKGMAMKLNPQNTLQFYCFYWALALMGRKVFCAACSTSLPFWGS